MESNAQRTEDFSELDAIALTNRREAQAIADRISESIHFAGWKPCHVFLINEYRRDRFADSSWTSDETLIIRLFRDGWNVGTLIHEMAHNSMFCLFDLVREYGLKFVSNGHDDVHGVHHELMVRILTVIYYEEVCGKQKNRQQGG